jgi:hypothetical protein
LAKEDGEIEKESLQARMVELETGTMEKLLADVEKDEADVLYSEEWCNVIRQSKTRNSVSFGESQRSAIKDNKWVKAKLKKQFEYVLKNMETSV